VKALPKMAKAVRTDFDRPQRYPAQTKSSGHQLVAVDETKSF